MKKQMVVPIEMQPRYAECEDKREINKLLDQGWEVIDIVPCKDRAVCLIEKDADDE